MTDTANKVLSGLRELLAGIGSADRLPTERDLSERMGVGRRAVRLALEVLEEEGMIWRRQGKGTFMGVPADPRAVVPAGMIETIDALAVMEGRICIEPSLAALAAQRATDQDVARMRRFVEHIGTRPDTDTAEVWDAALHRQIATAAGNPILLTAFQLIDAMRTRDDFLQMRQRARSPESLALYDGQHRAIVEAIAARDSEAARRAMAAHLEQLSQNLTAALMTEAT